MLPNNKIPEQLQKRKQEEHKAKITSNESQKSHERKKGSYEEISIKLSPAAPSDHLKIDRLENSSNKTAKTYIGNSKVGSYSGHFLSADASPDMQVDLVNQFFGRIGKKTRVQPQLSSQNKGKSEATPKIDINQTISTGEQVTVHESQEGASVIGQLSGRLGPSR